MQLRKMLKTNLIIKSVTFTNDQKKSFDVVIHKKKPNQLWKSKKKLDQEAKWFIHLVKKWAWKRKKIISFSAVQAIFPPELSFFN